VDAHGAITGSFKAGWQRMSGKDSYINSNNFITTGGFNSVDVHAGVGPCFPLASCFSHSLFACICYALKHTPKLANTQT
jgi:hypothetical protein